MKLRNIIILAIIIIVPVVGVWWFRSLRETPVMVKTPRVARPTVAPKPETQAEQEERWSRDARTAFAAAITNDLPGHKRTIRTWDTIVTGQPVSNWTANAAVEYVDKTGEFGRTTLSWRFETNAGAIRIIPIRY